MKNKQYLGFLLFLMASGCASTEDTDCTNGTRKCDLNSNAVMTCGTDGWEIAEVCPTGLVCNGLTLRCESQSGSVVCNSGAKMCSMDGKQVLVCSNNNWTMSVQCGADEQCDAGTLTCVKQSAAGCVSGSKQCSQDGSQVMSCVNGEWTVDKKCGSDERCDSSYQCTKQNTSTCVDGTRKCDGNTIVECKNGAYNVVETCVSPAVCVSSSLQCQVPRICTPGEKKCDTDLSRVLLCSEEGSWTVMENCDTTNGASCDMSTVACRTGCTEGASRCDNNNRFLKCTGNTWAVVKDCLATERCDNTNGCAECSVGQQRCANESSFYTCTDGRWSSTATNCGSKQQCISDNCVDKQLCTADVCRNGNAVTCKDGVESVEACGSKNCILRDGKALCEEHVCDDGQFKCDSETEKSICSDNKWIKSNCDSGFVCELSARGCIEFVCNEGEKRCNANAVEKCTDNVWHPDESCGATRMCDDSTKTCVQINCSNGDKRCNDGKVEKCSSNAYTPDQTCTSSQICSQTGTSASCVVKVCNEGEYKCDGQKLQRCVDNAWKSSQTCDSSTQLCKASGTTGTCETKVCNEGATKCDNNTNSVMVCENNAWKSSKCKNTEYCDYEDSAYKCIEKECENGVVCDGTTLKICTNYQYSRIETCLGNQRCNASIPGCELVPECTNGKFKCTGSTLYKCNGGSWSESNICAGENEVCDASKGQCIDTSECTTGNFYCDGKTLKECKSGKWTNKTTCKDTETCNATTKQCDLTPVCNPDEVTCNGQTLRTCDSTGQWKDTETCTGGKTCDESLKKCRECTSGYQCRVQDKGYQVYECKEGAWVSIGSSYYCNSQYTCDADLGRCTQCYGSEYTCHGSNLMQCSNYSWTTKMECGTGKHCDASKPGCVDDAVCTSGYTCVGQELKECQSGQWELKETCGDAYTCNSTDGKCDLKPVCSGSVTECDGNTLKTCNASGQWDTTPCGDSAVCVTSGSSSSCVNKIALPEWCNIQGIDIINHGYGRVLMPASVNTDDITAKFVCGKVSTPVMSWTYASEAVVNTGCTHEDGCDPNTEFISYSMNAPVGSYQCTYRFEFGPQTIACLPRKDDDNNGGTPIVLDSSTKLTDDQTMPLTLIAASTEAPEWCWFKHFDTKEYGSTWEAYGRILPPNPTSPAQIKAMLICGDVTKPASTWTVKRDAKENLFCNDCAAGHYEYASVPLFDTPEPSANYVCAFRMDVAGKSYVCPTRNDGPGAEGGTPVELTSGLVLPEGTYWGY